MINNEFYDSLNEAWYTAWDHPIALLRAENNVRSPWIEKEIESHFHKKIAILDIGCGGGFLTNRLAEKGHQVTGIDLSEKSLRVAKKYDTTQSVQYLKANAYDLPFTAPLFDVVSAMDILEHVENPAKLIEEAARVLKPGGLFFYHTFNRTWVSRLVVIKGVDWFVKNAPKNMHVYELFLKPSEVQHFCKNVGLENQKLLGFVPSLNIAFWKLLLTREISPAFTFKFVHKTHTGYCGFAKKA